MNERIKELEAQCWEPKQYGPPWFDSQKFAELIVSECVKKCEFVADMAEITNTGEMARKTKATANSCAQMIEQHFGVQE